MQSTVLQLLKPKYQICNSSRIRSVKVRIDSRAHLNPVCVHYVCFRVLCFQFTESVTEHKCLSIGDCLHNNAFHRKLWDYVAFGCLLSPGWHKLLNVAEELFLLLSHRKILAVGDKQQWQKQYALKTHVLTIKSHSSTARTFIIYPRFGKTLACFHENYRGKNLFPVNPKLSLKKEPSSLVSVPKIC